MTIDMLPYGFALIVGVMLVMAAWGNRRRFK